MIKEAYCSYEIAKLLKEKEFEIATSRAYDEQGNLDYNVCICVTGRSFVYAPTHQMACAWLREVHDLYIEVVRGYDHFFVSIDKMHPLREYSMKNDTFDDYDDAIEAALKYSLENLI